MATVDDYKGPPENYEDPIVNIHFDFDGFKPHRLTSFLEKYKLYYNVHMMVPPGDIQYFYSVGGDDILKPPIDFSKIKTFTDGGQLVMY